jgi:hypothetical protein
MRKREGGGCHPNIPCERLVYNNTWSLLARCDTKLRLKKELSLGRYETISKLLVSKPIHVNIFAYRNQITHFAVNE